MTSLNLMLCYSSRHFGCLNYKLSVPTSLTIINRTFQDVEAYFLQPNLNLIAKPKLATFINEH